MTQLTTSILSASIAFGALFNAHAADESLYFDWLDSYKEGLRQAEITGKPMLLNFRCVP